jgi:hypothetical protein
LEPSRRARDFSHFLSLAKAGVFGFAEAFLAASAGEDQAGVPRGVGRCCSFVVGR